MEIESDERDRQREMEEIEEIRKRIVDQTEEMEEQVCSDQHKNDGAIFVWPWKMDSVSVRYLIYQPMDEKIKTWLVGLTNRVAVWRQSEVSVDF